MAAGTAIECKGKFLKAGIYGMSKLNCKQYLTLSKFGERVVNFGWILVKILIHILDKEHMINYNRNSSGFDR